MNGETIGDRLSNFSPRTSTLTRISLTIALPVQAVLVNEWLRPYLEPAFDPALTAAVAVVCWFCGPVFAIAALALSSLLFVYFFLPPYYTLALVELNSALRLLFFLGSNALITALISNLYRAQSNIRTTERIYRNLSELIPFGGWIADAHGQMQHVSDSFLNTFGVSMADCRGLGWAQLIDGDQRPTVLSEWRKCIETGYFWDYQYRMRSKTGEVVTVLSRGVPVMDQSGKTQSWVGIHLDITDRERSAEEQLRQARDIARFNAELEQFAYISAHDLQEPLRMIASYLQLLQRRYTGKLDAEADQFIGYAVEGATRLRALLQDLMVLQNIGKSSATRQPHSLNAIVSRAVSHLGGDAANARIECGQLPVTVCNEPEFIQLFEHLIGNAVKYRRADATPKVTITAAAGPEGCTVCVGDNGIGIEPEYLSRIFDVFQRLHPRSQYPGTGIGLAICRKVVEGHGGRIWAESTPGEGSSFYFTLPETRC